MERYISLNKILILFFTLVWVINGVFCKLLNLVPRHQQIVAEILGEASARPLTIAIGFGELLMAIWIFSRKFNRVSSLIQILLVGVMNILEFILVPELLLWGRLNLLFALGFIVLVYYQGFILQSKIERGRYG